MRDVEGNLLYLAVSALMLYVGAVSVVRSVHRGFVQRRFASRTWAATGVWAMLLGTWLVCAGGMVLFIGLEILVRVVPVGMTPAFSAVERSVWSAASVGVELVVAAVGCLGLYITKALVIRRQFECGSVVVRGWPLLPIGTFFGVVGAAFLLGGLWMLWQRV